MKTFLNIHICWIVLLSLIVNSNELYAPPIRRPKIEFIPPYGLRFSVVDLDYILVAFHYRINEPLYNVDAGKWNVDVNQKTGNLWVHENLKAGVQTGDTVNYWINVRPNRTRIDENLLNQSYVLEAPTTIASGRNKKTSEVTSVITVVTATSVEGGRATFTSKVMTVPTIPGTSAIHRDNSTAPIAAGRELTILTTLTTASNFSDDNNNNNLSNFTYLIAFSSLGVILMLCVTVIIICCVRYRGYKTDVKESRNSNVQFKNNLSGHTIQNLGHDRDNRNRNMNVDRETLDGIHHNATNRDINTGIASDQGTTSRTISRHVYDSVDNNVDSVAIQYDYTECQCDVYDMPKDFMNKLKSENKYDVLSRNRGDNQDRYQPLNTPHSYLELV